MSELAKTRIECIPEKSRRIAALKMLLSECADALDTELQAYSFKDFESNMKPIETARALLKIKSMETTLEKVDELIKVVCISYNSTLYRQPEDNRDQPAAMKVAITPLVDRIKELEEMLLELIRYSATTRPDDLWIKALRTLKNEV